MSARIFQHIPENSQQEYSRIFRQIQAYSDILMNLFIPHILNREVIKLRI